MLISQRISSCCASKNIFCSKVERLKKNDIIVNFIGIWPSINIVRYWIGYYWFELKPKVILLALGFLQIGFDFDVDKDKVLKGGPLFMCNVGLYLKKWYLGFNLYSEQVKEVPLWIRLHKLAHKLWAKDIQRFMGNSLGEFMCNSSSSVGWRFSPYAHIHVKIDLSKNT
ncbi:hypothetical protein SUGI_0325850 [Cryptomeria japonica]|nr:hypothetical protein SUGI_0325850 [Cryptomeria japonica]